MSHCAQACHHVSVRAFQSVQRQMKNSQKRKLNNSSNDRLRKGIIFYEKHRWWFHCSNELTKGYNRSKTVITKECGKFTPRESYACEMLKKRREIRSFDIKDSLVSFKPDKPKEGFNKAIPNDLFFLFERVTNEECH